MMTIKRYKQIMPYVDAWANDKNIGVPDKDFKSLILTDANPFELYLINEGIFVINDWYVNLRLALMRGEELEYGTKDGDWITVSDAFPTMDFKYTPKIYRIKEKIDTSWVADGTYCTDRTGAIYRISSHDKDFNINGGSYSKADVVNIYKEWRPSVSDKLCLFWNNNRLSDHGLSVKPFIGTIIKDSDKNYISENGIYENCIPYMGDKPWIS